MITATDILRKEHDAILRMLDAAEETAQRLERGGEVAAGTLTGLVEFFQLFADRCHHSKEEDLLFPLLARKGLPQAGGPIEVMLIEHTQGRKLIRRMSEAAAVYGAGDEEAGRRWAEAARDYVALLRDHIAKENHVLFRIAERLLSYTEQRELAVAFDQVEQEKMGAGTHERLHALMDRLAGSLLPG